MGGDNKSDPILEIDRFCIYCHQKSINVTASIGLLSKFESGAQTCKNDEGSCIMSLDRRRRVRWTQLNSRDGFVSIFVGYSFKQVLNDVCAVSFCSSLFADHVESKNTCALRN